MAFLKPQNPMTKGSDYFYPLTTADQVIMDGGYRLNDIVGKVKKSTITLYANGWSVEVPHCYSVIVDGLSNNTDMKILPRFPEDFESKQIMREETAKISFASRNNNILTFECWDEIPTIDIPIDIEINILYPNVPDINLNYSIIGGTTEPENPSENMIWINTENEITSHKLSKYEPNNPVEGMVWIYLGDASNVHFHTLSMNERELDEVYPLSAKQYVSGAWADVTAKSYQGGEWVDWITYLYDNGAGIDSFELKSYKFEAIITSSATDNTGYVTLYAAGATGDAGSPAGAMMVTKEKKDLSEYNSLKVRRKIRNIAASGYSGFVVECATKYNQYGYFSTAIASYHEQSATDNDIISIDISDINESAYICLRANVQSASADEVRVDVNEIWFE